MLMMLCASEQLKSRPDSLPGLEGCLHCMGASIRGAPSQTSALKCQPRAGALFPSSSAGVLVLLSLFHGLPCVRVADH